MGYVFCIWNDEGFVEPEIEEGFDPDRTVLSLSFIRKATEKGNRKRQQKKTTKRTREQYDKILAFMKDDTWYKAEELLDVLGLKKTRTKELLRGLVAEKKLEDNGETKGKTYRKISRK